MRAVEDGLLAQRIALVHVDERLMVRVVGEERGLEIDAPRRSSPSIRSAKRRPWRSGTGVMSLSVTGDVAAVEPQVQPAGEDLGERRAVPPGHGRVEQGVGIGDLQFEGRVEVVDRERAGHGPAAPSRRSR